MKHNPPKHLDKAGKAWFRRVVQDYEFRTGAEIELLVQAASTLDRIEQCRDQIKTDGLTVPTAGGGCKPHPAANIERDNRTLFARLCRELRLNEPAPDEQNRIPRIGR